MIAKIQNDKDGFTARYERHFHHFVEKVWSMLTDNEKLQQWFSELQIADLRKGGLIKFDMQDGTFIDMEILDYEAFRVLAFEWGEDIARFELSPTPEGCHFLFIETITSFTDQTIKDLAGWHVCLDVVEALLDGRTIVSRKEQWESWYVKYKELLENITK